MFVVGYILVVSGPPLDAPAEPGRAHRSCVGFDLTARHSNPPRLEQVPRLWSSSLTLLSAEVGYCSNGQVRPPRFMVTDKLVSDAAAKEEIVRGVERRQRQGLNDRAENAQRRCEDKNPR